MFSVITIDFWQTLYDNANGKERKAQRKKALAEAISAENPAPDLLKVEKAYASLWDYFDHHWLGRQRTPTSEEMVGFLLQHLDVSLSDERLNDIVRVFEEGILEHPPNLLPGVREGLEYLTSGARLALISDTAFSPGSVLRRVMERDDIARHFEVFVFSNETGLSKPHPEAFRMAIEPLGGEPETSLHIGDIERTDIRGAKGIGMRTILYRNSRHLHKYNEEETEADGIMEEWSEIESVVESIL